MARRGRAGQGTRQGLARRGLARRGEERGRARLGRAGLGKEQGTARRGKARHGEEQGLETPAKLTTFLWSQLWTKTYSGAECQPNQMFA